MLICYVIYSIDSNSKKKTNKQKNTTQNTKNTFTMFQRAKQNCFIGSKTDSNVLRYYKQCTGHKRRNSTTHKKNNKLSLSFTTILLKVTSAIQLF